MRQAAGVLQVQVLRRVWAAVKHSQALLSTAGAAAFSGTAAQAAAGIG
jgi:hypothetical protein